METQELKNKKIKLDFKNSKYATGRRKKLKQKIKRLKRKKQLRKNLLKRKKQLRKNLLKRKKQLKRKHLKRKKYS